MVNKNYIIILLFVILASNVIAEEISFVPTIDSGQEVAKFGYKFSNSSGIIISTKPIISCDWKPDIFDDGWKTCEAIFEVQSGENKVIPFPKLDFQFESPDQINNSNYLFSDTSLNKPYAFITTSREVDSNISKIHQSQITLNKREYSHFQPIPEKIDLSVPFAIKLIYEAPKYSKNKFNLILSGENMIAQIDPDQTGCGTLSSSGTYTLTQDVNSSYTCFLINTSNVILDCQGYKINYSQAGNGSAYGVYAKNVYNATIKNCIILEATFKTTNQYGVYLENSTNSVVMNNTIITRGNMGDGVSLYRGSSHLVTLNQINTSGVNGLGIFMGESNATISYNNITIFNKSAQAIWTYSNGGSYYISNVLKTFGNLSEGISTLGINNSIFENNLIITSSSGNGISLSSSTLNNFTGNIINVSGPGGYGIYLSGGVNTFVNTKINATDYDIYFNSGNITFINSTFNKSDIKNQSGSVGDIYVKWYVSINITNTTLGPISGATVNSYNNFTGELEQSSTTDSSGTTLQTLTEFKLNSTHKIYFTNHTIQVSASGYYSNSININLSQTDSTVVNLILQPIPPGSSCGPITTSTTLPMDLSATGTCFTINASNIILDGAGHQVWGNGSGYGVLFNGYNNVTIRNLILRSFMNGIYASTSQNSTIVNNYIETSNVGVPDGMFTEYVTRSNISNNTIITTGQYATGIYLGMNSSYNVVSYNTINTSGTQGYGIRTSSSLIGTTIYFNKVITKGYAASGLDLRSNTTAYSNSIRTFGTNAYGIYLGGTGLNVSYNDIIVYNTSAQGIYLAEVNLSLVYQNNVTANGSSGSGIWLYNSKQTTISSNHIIVPGPYSEGIHIDGSNTNLFSSNGINTSGENGYAVSLQNGAEANTLLNNDLNSTKSYEIYDFTGSSTLNYLVYNNSYGQIRWNSTTFLDNLTTNGTVREGVTIFIGNNTASLNKSSFNIGAINSTAEITLRGINLTDVNQVKRLDIYNTNATQIREQGSDCVGNGCTILSYSDATLVFNTSNLGSFTAIDVSEVNVRNLSLIQRNSSGYAAFRFVMENTANYMNYFNWSLETGEDTIRNTMSTSLEQNRGVFVFVERNYGILGTYAIRANGTTTSDRDNETKSYTIS